MDRKRIILLALFSLLVIVIGWLLWIVFFAPRSIQSPIDQTGTDQTGSSGFPSVGTGGDRTPVDTGTPTIPSTGGTTGGTTGQTSGGSTTGRADQIISSQVSNVATSPGGLVRYYDNRDGKFYQISNNGTLTELSDQVFFQASNVVWSPVNEQAIIEYPDGANILYNFSTKSQVTLPAHWQEFSFSPQGDQIVAKSITLAPENRWLITTDASGKNVTFVEPMGTNADKVIVDWSPNKQIVALSKTGRSLGADREEILLVGQYGENFKSLVVEGRGIVSEWSPTGDKLLYSVYSSANDYKPSLWIVDAAGDAIGNNRTALNVETWADKCSFQDDRFVYCGVPISLQTGAGFAPETANTTNDVIYKIDTKTGIKTEIQTTQNYIVDSITVSEDGSTLFVTDKLTPGLFAVPL